MVEMLKTKLFNKLNMKNSFNSAITAGKYIFAAILVTPVLIALMSIFGDFLPDPAEAETGYSQQVINQQAIYDKIATDLSEVNTKIESRQRVITLLTELQNKDKEQQAAIKQTLCSAQVVLAQLKANETGDPAERAKLMDSVNQAKNCFM